MRRSGLCVREPWGGRDVLPAMFRHYVSDPDRKLFVGVYEGKVVTITGGRVIDDGLTWEGQSGRALPETTGAFHLTRVYLLKHFIIPQCPNTKRIRGTIRNEKAARESVTVICVPAATRAIVDLAWKVSLTTIDQAIDIYSRNFQPRLEETGDRVRHTDRSGVSLMFEDREFQRKYIPSGVLVYDSKPLDVQYRSNLRFVYSDKEPNVFISKHSNRALEAISFGTGIEMGVTLDTLRYVVDYYGVRDLDTLIVHTMKHISTIPRLFLQSRTARSVYVAVFLLEEQFELSFLQEFVQFMTGELFLDSGNADIPYSHQFVVEGELSLDNVTKSRL